MNYKINVTTSFGRRKFEKSAQVFGAEKKSAEICAHLRNLRSILVGLRQCFVRWLQNDYAKFIRFGKWQIEKTGNGLIRYITDDSYLDAPTFRGMRQNLLSAFDELWLLDLHGNSKKQGLSPNSIKDDNVFDIQQGVAIFIGAKKL